MSEPRPLTSDIQPPSSSVPLHPTPDSQSPARAAAQRLRVLIALTYYRPHVSGLTIYAERLARGLVRRGHAVTVLTARFSPQLPARESVDGVEVVRVPVAWKVSKGVIMPTFPAYAASLLYRHDVINVHMPQFESPLLVGLGRLLGKAVVLTYQCDLRMPHGWFNRLVEASLRPLNEVAARAAHAIVVTTSDYASHSAFLSRHAAKLHAIPALVDLPAPRAQITARLAQRWGTAGRVCIGFAARFAAEKGVEYLLRAMPTVLAHYPDAHVLFTGAYKDTVGEDEYWHRLAPLLERHREHFTFLDLLDAEEMPSFFALCDAVAVTSLNSTEAFGLVQVESMLSGTPVVATDLPGVREAVRRTGMGRIVPPRDPEALAAALIDVLQHRDRYVRPRREIEAHFDLDASLRLYEDLFAKVAGPRR
jgi:glycosyltransferase involved in cell wall biosynthesis